MHLPSRGPQGQQLYPSVRSDQSANNLHLPPQVLHAPCISLPHPHKHVVPPHVSRYIARVETIGQSILRLDPCVHEADSVVGCGPHKHIPRSNNSNPW